MSVHASEARTPARKVRVPDIVAAKGQRRLACLTCYDATFARLCDASALDVVLVGDSLGNVVQGQRGTTGVTVSDVAYHTRAVASCLRNPLLVADMPFGSAGFSMERAMRDAEELIRAGAEAVKIEGATLDICEQIARLTRHGIPVMGHIGLIPQSVHALGGYRIQGKTAEGRVRLCDEAKRLEDAGCFSIVLELMDSVTAQAVTESVRIPTVGIGAGRNCDGQILVITDMLGLNLEFSPKYLKRYARLEEIVREAIGSYCSEVGEGLFPEG